MKPRQLPVTLTLKVLEDLEKSLLPTHKEQTFILSQCPNHSGLKPLMNDLYESKKARSNKQNLLTVVARCGLVFGPTQEEWERMTAGEDKKWIEGCYRKFYVRVVPRLPSVAAGPLPGSIPKRTVVEAAVETTATVVQPTPTVAALPPHLDPSLTAEQLNRIYMRAGAFPAGEDLQSIYRLRGLLRCDK